MQGKVNKELEKREGTDIDCKRLRETFENLNISVHVRENLVHDKIIPEITSTIEDYLIEDRHSVFFLCILSHGAKGMISAVCVYLFVCVCVCVHTH